jgi:hypothetical protein
MRSILMAGVQWARVFAPSSRCHEMNESVVPLPLENARPAICCPSAMPAMTTATEPTTASMVASLPASVFHGEPLVPLPSEPASKST